VNLLRSIISFIKNMGALGPVLGFSVIGPAIGALVLAATSDGWFPWLEGGHHPTFIIGLCAILCGISFVPTHACSLVLGMLYGPLWGSLSALLSVLAGSFCGYYFFGALVGDQPLQHLKKDPKVAEIHHQLTNSDPIRSLTIIFLLRLSPIMPFAATNTLLASLKVPFSVFASASLFGLAPRVIAVVLIGAGLQAFTLDQGGQPAVLIIGGFATFLLPLYLYWVLKKRNSELNSKAPNQKSPDLSAGA
jgi:uncharacterized membrane protein YdjX (TVP38/TMEM64 family)